MRHKLSYESLSPHLKNLRICGFYQLDSKAKNIHKTLHTLYMRLILSLILLYTVQQIIKVYQVRNDSDKVMDTMFLLLTNSDSIYKQVVLWTKADRVEEMLKIMKGSIFNQKKLNHQIILLRTAKQAKTLLRVFNIVALSTCLLWVLYPVMLFRQGKHVEFAIWLPFDPEICPQFYFAIIYIWLQTSWLAYNNTTMDAFISFFLFQCKTQVSILRLDLENLIEKSKNKEKNSQVPLTNIHRRFKNILVHHNEIVNFSNKIQDIFGGAVLYQFLVSSWIICTTAYRTININPTSMEFVSMIMYMGCMLTELFLFCYIGNEVTHESEKLMESAYAMDWLKIPIKYRHILIVFMERFKRPIEPMAGVMVPLSNTTFVSILRSSYSFYAFLKNTKTD